MADLPVIPIAANFAGTVFTKKWELDTIRSSEAFRATRATCIR